ncbi:MAG: hypothetical protein FJ388_21475, partial [Verrucomicrobia bacterium]|nr:hypothetical protein [Verrucomicrobiota bacterium]
ESLWPAVGAVLVHDGVLYAHAGRTSESDGGVAIVALDPATGAQLWAKNVAPGPLRMNDLLRVSDGKIQWHHLALDPKTGAGDLKAAAGKKDGSQGGVMDGSWTLLGDRRAGKAFQVGRAASNLMAWNDTLLVAPSFAITKEKALAPAPEPPPLPDGKKAPPPALKSSDYTWQFAATKGQQVEAIALTANAVVYAGRDTQTGEDKPTGFLRLVSLADGKKLAELPLDAPPTYDGLAIANGRVYVSLQNGALVSFAK